MKTTTSTPMRTPSLANLVSSTPIARSSSSSSSNVKKERFTNQNNNILKLERKLKKYNAKLKIAISNNDQSRIDQLNRKIKKVIRKLDYVGNKSSSVISKPSTKNSKKIRANTLNKKLTNLNRMLTKALNNNETSSINRLNKEIHNIINKINLDDLQYKQVIKIKLDSITKKILNLQYEQSNINRSSSPNRNKLYEIKKNIRIQKERLYKIRKTEEKRIAFYYKSIVEILRKLEDYYYNDKENSNNNVMDFVEKQIRYYLYKLKTLDEAQVMLMKYKINFMRNSIKQRRIYIYLI
jgi:hypothetical protein